MDYILAGCNKFGFLVRDCGGSTNLPISLNRGHRGDQTSTHNATLPLERSELAQG